MEPLAIAVAGALAILIVLRRPGVFSPVALADGPDRLQALPLPGEEEEQQPETDRAPQRWLPWGVAAVALVRLALLLTLHA